MHIAHTQSSVYRSDGKTVRKGGLVSPQMSSAATAEAMGFALGLAAAVVAGG